jgi:hypothetical protein
LSEELIEKVRRLLELHGYELIGVYDRTQLDLGATERCHTASGPGVCSCAVDLNIVLHEVDASDVAIVVFADAFAFPEPLEESEWCDGSIDMELYVEFNNIKQTVAKFSTKPCTVYV